MKNLLYILLFVSFFFFSSCDDNEIQGCVDYYACNYNNSATSDDGTCEYAEQGYDCDGNIIAEIGDEFQGGILFYINETGEHGLISAIEDIGDYPWGCYETNLNYADGQVIGSGLQNSLDIVLGCSDRPIAASEALAYECEGYSDWYLPSKLELFEMYLTIGPQTNFSDISMLSDTAYWSSTKANSTTAWFVYFDINFGSSGSTSRINDYKVRPIRSF